MARGGVQNIWSAWLRSTADERLRGRSAYRDYRHLIGDLASIHMEERPLSENSLSRAVGVFAALSPGASEADTISGMCNLLRGRQRGDELARIRCRSYPDSKDKAWRILHGESPLTILGGPKTSNFYRNILYPDDPVAVTVDAHAYSAWLGKRLKVTEPRITLPLYDQVAADYRVAAAAASILPSQMQATCWFAWRRLHDVRPRSMGNNGQFVLFGPDHDPGHEPLEN